MNRESIEKTIRDWMPRRDHNYDFYYGGKGDQRKGKLVYQSPNFKVFISIGGDIYDFHLNIGNLVIAWETDRNRRN